MRPPLIAALTSLVALLPTRTASLSTTEPQHTVLAAYKRTCREISRAISDTSAVHWPNTPEYEEDIFHYTPSSTDASACSVRPATARDVSTILRVLASNRTPFAIKGGGHAQNPGFSSTPGVHIAMSEFNQVVYESVTRTVDAGAGLAWDDVYAALAPFGVNVVGGRVTGIGVAGLTLGGGYSWKTNQYGLALDNVVAFELVLPNGDITVVTEDCKPELFFGLKGGYNNFGIVTKFTLKAYPQSEVWGGSVAIAGDFLDQVTAATIKFANSVKDPKAAILPSYYNANGTFGASILLFYDAPTPPPGIFDDFLAIPAQSTDVSSRSFLSMVHAAPSESLKGTRAVYHTVPVLNYTETFIAAIRNESTFWVAKTGQFISYDIEPFLPSILSHAPASSAAYPPSRAHAYSPLAINIAWPSADLDETMQEVARESAAQLTRVLEAEGQRFAGAPLYGNYALFGTPRERIFGDGETWARLRELKARYDPENAMGLAGGWKIE